MSNLLLHAGVLIALSATGIILVAAIHNLETWIRTRWALRQTRKNPRP